MEYITSSQNKLVKKLIQLSAKSKVRQKEGLTILEGAHLAQEYLKMIGKPKICIIRKGDYSSEIEAIINNCLDNNARIIELPDNLYQKISPVVDGAGIMFVIEIPHTTRIDPNANTVILDDVQDAGNLGTILRSAAAFDVEQIICSPGTVKAFSPKVLRSGMGAHFHVKIFENQDLGKVISRLKVSVIATSLDATDDFSCLKVVDKVAWVFGNEGQGVSQKIQQLAGRKIKIPHTDNVESLNVAQAATICLYEQFKNH